MASRRLLLFLPLLSIRSTRRRLLIVFSASEGDHETLSSRVTPSEHRHAGIRRAGGLGTSAAPPIMVHVLIRQRATVARVFKYQQPSFKTTTRRHWDILMQTARENEFITFTLAKTSYSTTTTASRYGAMLATSLCPYPAA